LAKLPRQQLCSKSSYPAAAGDQGVQTSTVNVFVDDILLLRYCAQSVVAELVKGQVCCGGYEGC
jgi:hypothetical protein